MGAGLPGGRGNGTGGALQRESRAFPKGGDNRDSLSIRRRVYSECESLPGPGSSPAMRGLPAILMGYRLPIQPHTTAALKPAPPARHVTALLDLGAALVLFLDTLGHGFFLGCFLSTREDKPECCPSSACCPDAVRVSISSPSSPELDTHPGEASTACPDLCPMWKQRQKCCIDLFSPFGIIFSKCTSPLLPFGPAKGLWAGRQGSSPFSSPLLNLLPREQPPQISMEPGSDPPLVCATPDVPLAAVPSPAP